MSRPGRPSCPATTHKQLGAQLRAIRTQQGLSLHGVEEKSQGRWKAVVVGSYERGDRAVTVQRLAELADFYGVPVPELLPGAHPGRRRRAAAALVLDLERLAQVPPEKAGPLPRYAATIQSQRGDYNGQVLSIRQDDLRTLAVIYDQSPSVAHRAADQLGRPRRGRPPRGRSRGQLSRLAGLPGSRGGRTSRERPPQRASVDRAMPLRRSRPRLGSVAPET